MLFLKNISVFFFLITCLKWFKVCNLEHDLRQPVSMKTNPSPVILSFI